MPAQKGSEVLVALGDGSDPQNWTTIGGDQNSQIQYEDQEGVFTHKTSSNLWEEIMDGGTVRRLTITVDLVDIDDASVQTIVAALFGTSTRHQPLRFTMPGLGTVDADAWHIPNFSYSGELNNPSGMQLTAVAAEQPTFSAS